MKWDDVFKKQYLAAKDIPTGGINGIIRLIEVEDVGGDEKPKDYKPVLYLEGIEQGITVNHTRRLVLETAWGDDSDLAIGKELKLSRGRTHHMGKPVDCIVFFAINPILAGDDSNVTIVN